MSETPAPQPVGIAFVGLGANLGDRRATVRDAALRLGSTRGVVSIAVGPVIETDPVGPPDQPRYINTVARVETALSPRELLDTMLAIEQAFGRDRAREERWGPRTIDLDLLLYDDLIVDEPGLTLPHPRMHERRFVLEPLAALAPDLIHPVLRTPIAELLAQVV